MPKEATLKTQSLASKRVHVERLVRRVKENKLFNFCQRPICPVLANSRLSKLGCINPQEFETLANLVTHTVPLIVTRLVLLNAMLAQGWTLSSCQTIALCRRHLGPEKNLIARQHHNQSMHYAETIQRMKSCVCNNNGPTNL